MSPKVNAEDRRWERQELKRAQEREQGSVRHPKPELPYEGQKGKGKCVRCGKAREKGRKKWCSDACLKAYYRDRGFTYRQDAIAENKRLNNGKLVCVACGIECLEHEPYVVYNEQLGRYVDGEPEEFDRVAEVVHVKRLAVGGTHELSNLRVLCRPCHRAKTAREAARPPRPPVDHKLEEFECSSSG